MSIDYSELLLRRARMYLESAELNLSAGRFDVAAVEAEVAAQLALKALIVKLGFEPPRTHSVRQLLSFVVDCGLLPGEALEELRGFARSPSPIQHYQPLAVAAGQYGGAPVDRDEAEISVACAREVVRLAERSWELAGR